MKSIGKVRLSLNNDAEVVVTTDLHLKDKDDIDTIYFIMFSVLHLPLRLSVAVVGNCSEILMKRGESPLVITDLLKNNPEGFLKLLLKDPDTLFVNAQEKVRIMLDSEKNAHISRAVVASMIEKGFYHQITHYYVDGEKVETVTQKNPTEQSQNDMLNLLEIIKRWENFDLKEFLIEKGADISQLEGIEGL